MASQRRHRAHARSRWSAGSRSSTSAARATSGCGRGWSRRCASCARRGLHLGIVSNIDEDDLHHLIDRGELRALFDSLLSSEAAGSCKPDARIFALALERAGCAPEEALFVGDSLPADVAGANRAGMRSVLLWHRDDKPPPADVRAAAARDPRHPRRARLV